MVTQKMACITSLNGSDDLPCTNSVQAKNRTKVPKILSQRNYDSQTVSDTLNTMTKRKKITFSPQKLWRRFSKQDLKNQLLEELPNENLLDSTREVTLTDVLDAENVTTETKKKNWFRGGERAYYPKTSGSYHNFLQQRNPTKPTRYWIARISINLYNAIVSR